MITSIPPLNGSEATRRGVTTVQGKDSRMLPPLPARLVLVCLAFLSVAADFKTRNFVVHAPSVEIAEQVGKAAEVYRRELAKEWLGEEMPPWAAPCPITVKVGQIGAGGVTTFNFGGGEVYGWKMTIQGTLERVLDSVLPHEISHTIFACHFRCPLPRWADEGASTLCEHESERRRQELTVQEVLPTVRRIPLRKLMAMKEYPSDMRDVLTLYAQGYSLADLLVQQGGKPKFLAFLKESMRTNYDSALKRYYGYQSTEVFEKEWSGWVMAGSPPYRGYESPVGGASILASNNADGTQAASKLAAGNGRPAVVRGQNSEEDRSGVALASLGETAPSRPAGREVAPVPSTKRGAGLEAPPPSRKSVTSGEQHAVVAMTASLGEPDAANLRNDEPVVERPRSKSAGEPPTRISPLDNDPRTAIRTAELPPEYDWNRRSGRGAEAADPRTAEAGDDSVSVEGDDLPRTSGASGERSGAGRSTAEGPTRLASTAAPTTKRPGVKRRIPKYSEAYVEPGSRPLPDYVP